MLLLLKIKDIDTSNIGINNNLVKVKRWADQWKMLFNPDINKQAKEVYLSQRCEKSLSSSIIFNSNNVLTSPCQKYLGLASDSKLGFNEHITLDIKAAK